jgi:PIN domain nuclease of toxin-antitoxin system
MRALLDTHVLLWWLDHPDRFPGRTMDFLRDGRNELLWSAIGTMELAVKTRRGTLRVRGTLDSFVEDRRVEMGFLHLPVEHRHALAVAGLPLVHGDPFDRLLVAQAKVEGIPLISRDILLRKYGIEVIW